MPFCEMWETGITHRHKAHSNTTTKVLGALHQGIKILSVEEELKYCEQITMQIIHPMK